MIRILIQRITQESYTETQNFIVKSTPTEIIEKDEDRYGGGTKTSVKCIEEYKTEGVSKTRTVTTDMLAQNIEEDEDFDLDLVIKAINRL